MIETEKVQRRALKRKFNLPVSLSYIGLILKTGTWPANQIIQYSKLMFCHNIMKRGHKKVARKILVEQTKQKKPQKQPKERHDFKITKDNTRNRSVNKKCGEHEQIQIVKAGERKNRKVNRRKNKAGNDKKTKSITTAQETWERKKCLQKCDTGTIKDVIKIRLDMQRVNCNYKRDNTDTKYPLHKKLEDTTEPVLECGKAKKLTRSKENSKGKWEEKQRFIEKITRRENLQ